jgi:TonB family protein
MDLAFLSSSDLARLERRTAADHDPSRGVLAARPGSTPGSAPGVAPLAGSERAGLAGSAHQGTAASSPGEGVRDGVPGLEHRIAAAVASARPAVVPAPVSVEALVRARPRDNVDSEQELTSKVEALVHASTAGGVVAKTGVGGTAGDGAPGALGLAGGGSHPSPLGDGASDWFDLSSTDPRIVAYFRRFHAKVDPLWADAFPKSALLELQQGTVILDVTIAADGTAQVAWPPERPSGVGEFDRNCADAIRRASPFDPIPRELGLTRLHVRAPFVAKNPLVH